MVCEMRGKWPYSCCFVGCCFQNLFMTARSICVLPPLSLFSMHFVNAHEVHSYSITDTAWKKSSGVYLSTEFCITWEIYCWGLQLFCFKSFQYCVKFFLRKLSLFDVSWVINDFLDKLVCDFWGISKHILEIFFPLVKYFFFAGNF